MGSEPVSPRAAPSIEPAHDLLHQRRHPLDVFSSPRTVAVIGATERPASVGRTVLWNLISHPFGGTVFPINPHRESVLGIKAYPNLRTVPGEVELAVIVTPAQTVPAVVAECADANVKGAVIISAGFREIGAAGAKLEEEILAQARRGRMRVIGPNCLGVMIPPSGLNATFAKDMACSGSVAFISQSGALCTAILDWSRSEHVGFSAFISTGSMLDVGWGDLIDYLGNDPRTQSILLYMESIGDARSFLSAARAVALSKPIIVIKVGKSEAASHAAASHTGALTGSDRVLDAAFQRCGVLRVQSISDLFYMADVLGKQPLPKGSRLAILTNAGGPGVLATDALIAGGGELAVLSQDSRQALDKLLPAEWSHGDPIDILGDADPERYASALEITAKDPNSDGLLVILTPQAMTDPTSVAERVKAHARLEGKPILASWMGGISVEPGRVILSAAGIPVFAYPDTAVRAFDYMEHYERNLQGLYETPTMAGDSLFSASSQSKVQAVIESARKSGRTLLTETESIQILELYGIPVVQTRIARSESEAVKVAREIGYPVVLKLYSETITHKTDVGGVKLDLRDDDSVQSAYRAIEISVAEKTGPGNFLGVTVQPMVTTEGYELILGSSVDSQFGPVLLFGSGGQLVEVYRDQALALPPLTTTLAERVMEKTRMLTALKGVRGRRPVNLQELAGLLVRFSQLVVEQRWIKEIDINPLLASPDRLLALDARMVLYEPAMKEERLPQPSIRPYPSQYVSAWTMKDGTELTIRPIRPEDEPLIVKFYAGLAEHSLYPQYLEQTKPGQPMTRDQLIGICFLDYDREIALVAEYRDPNSHENSIVAAGRLSKLAWTGEAEIALVVSDKFQNRGLGTELVRQLLAVARQEGLLHITAEFLAENSPMQHLCQKLGFDLQRDAGKSIIHAVIELGAKDHEKAHGAD